MNINHHYQWYLYRPNKFLPCFSISTLLLPVSVPFLNYSVYILAFVVYVMSFIFPVLVSGTLNFDLQVTGYLCIQMYC